MGHIASQKEFIKIWDIVQHNLVQLPLPNYINYNSTTTRGHDYKLSIPFCWINIYKHSFFPSTIPKWNRLPARIVTAEMIDSFTNLLTNYLIWHCTTWVLAIIIYNMYYKTLRLKIDAHIIWQWYIHACVTEFNNGAGMCTLLYCSM